MGPVPSVRTVDGATGMADIRRSPHRFGPDNRGGPAPHDGIHALRLEQTLFGATFQNPVLLAAGTCGFGRELADIIDLDRLGGFVTKSVTAEARAGKRGAPGRPNFTAGMVNSIGLAKPGCGARAIGCVLPWLQGQRAARAGPDQRSRVTRSKSTSPWWTQLAGEDGFLGFELNLSCPNVGGVPFALDPGGH